MEELNIIRATNNQEYKKYVKNEICYKRNTSFVALNSNKEVISSCDFLIKNFTEAIIDNINIFTNIEVNVLYNMFIDEFIYWNPFIKQIYYNNHIKSINKNIDIFKVNLLDIEIQQLTVNKNKLQNVMEWVCIPEDVIVTVVSLDNKIVCIDGNTRLMCAYLKGFNYVYCYKEIDEYDINNFKEFKKWCEDENIYNIKDLQNRIVNDEDHQKIWIDRCQNYLNNK